MSPTTTSIFTRITINLVSAAASDYYGFSEPQFHHWSLWSWQGLGQALLLLMSPNFTACLPISGSCCPSAVGVRASQPAPTSVYAPQEGCSDGEAVRALLVEAAACHFPPLFPESKNSSLHPPESLSTLTHIHALIESQDSLLKFLLNSFSYCSKIHITYKIYQFKHFLAHNSVH